MKNKKSLYLLIPVSLVVWGFIAYKIISKISGDQTENRVVLNEITQNPKENTIDTFSIKNNYRDPFLETSYKPKKANTKSIKKKKTQTNNIQLKWPEVIYYGCLTNKSTNTVIVNLSINNKEILLKPGEVKAEIKLLDIQDDSVKIKYKDELKWILRQKK
jgi:hypothetical protein